MSRRWFAMLNGLLLSSMLVATAWGQASQQPPTLAERMAALRRGWSGNQAPPAQDQRPAVQSARVPQEESPSLWSNFLGRRAGPPPAQRSAAPVAANPSPDRGIPRQATARNPQAAIGSGQQARSISAPRAGVAPAGQSRSGSFQLPGLGGSPLPQTNATANAGNTPSGFNVSKEAVGAQRTVPETPNTQSINNPYVAGQRRPTTAPPAVVRSTPRQSPGQRPAPQVDADALRRELAGSYPVASSTSEPVARTARASATAEAAATPDIASNVAPVVEPVAAAEEQLPTEAIPTTTPAEQSLPGAADEVASNDSTVVPPAISPATAPERNSAADESDSHHDFSAAFSDGFSVRSPKTKPTEIAKPVARSKEAFGELQQPPGDDPSILSTNDTPVITTDIRGPKQITIGREANYRLQLRNQSDAAAEGIVATIRIPTWAEVVDTTTSQGMIQQPRNATGPGQLEWQLSRLEGHASETLDIKLVPRASRPLELGVSWTLSPVGSRAVVQVQEPKIQMSVSGPDEVLFSEPQVFRLMLSNPGTGIAEKVKIDLIPPGNAQATTSHVIGDLAPGASKTVEVELTAREAGKLFVKAIASAEGGLTSEAAKEIFCRKPELEVDWRGPETKYAGTPATYFLRVRNPGTAPADDVSLKVALPEGAEFISASEGQSYDAAKSEVSWQVGTLGPGDDNYMELKCLVNAPGLNQLRINATASTSELADEKLAETNVVALADLQLQVSDPSGPVAVGEQAVYEIRVQNRGANTASDVNIVALFSDGVEPDQVEGAMYTVADGRVTFRPIEELPAGREIVLRIRARAVQAGTHVFRAEVLCRDLDIKLAAEETTRFYAEDVLPEGSSGLADQAATRSDGFQPSVR
jgi:uncharacterized repeat protein (TIGR01451 family)